MSKHVRFHAAAICLVLLVATAVQAQQTLGGILGTVADKTGSVLPDSTVTLVGDQTQLTRTQKTNETGAYSFVNLPIGTYTLTFTHDGFQAQRISSIRVEADRSATLNVTLQVGQVGEMVEVQASPLMNAVDTTNGYVLEQDQIESAPLPTGSFTGLAILSPGVNAELPGGTGANSGLGNAPIWANGQRDTSNSFLLNGVDASNLFNGKSTSQVLSARVVLNTGTSTAASASAAPVQSTASPYLAIGQALPTPAPETIQELRVNTSMYDAQQGSTSGAHIDMSTKSGTNSLHGGLYGHRGTDWLNAAPFFFNQDPNIPADQKVPQLHRYTAGGMLGGPIIKDKVFGFVSYQHVHASDQEIGTSRPPVPFGLKNCLSGGPGCRDAADLANLANQNDLIPNNEPTITAANVDPVALALLQYKLPNGQFLIPSDNGNIPTSSFPENSFVPGTALFVADQAEANLDWNKSSKDTIALKYYYQHDPSVAPFAYSNVPGFPQHLDAGSQVASVSNVQSLRPNLSVVETLGILREKIYSSVGQPFSPGSIPSASGSQSINTFGDRRFPGITIADALGNGAPNNTGGCAPTPPPGQPQPANACPVFNAAMNFGGSAAAQAAFTGVFQNRIMPSANATWMLGRHTVNFGGSYAYTQLNTRDDRAGYGMIGFFDFSQFLTGQPTSYTSDGFVTTAYLQGNPNRYFRSGQTGLYVQDRYQFRSNLSVSAGLRFDWDGGLTEKYGRIYNFDPSRYSYDASTDTITSNGFIIAGNNKQFPTHGVSNTTLTGRQWGFAPRLGVAWSPHRFNDKVVVRAGTGMYYDRGELFSYLSPGFAAGVITAGPFGFNQTPPYVNAQLCNPTQPPYLGFIPTCGPQGFANPWGTTLQPAPTGNPADITKFLPNAAAIQGFPPAQLFSFATYNRANKLPYTINDTLDIQWQPRRDLAIEIGYVGNFGRHEVVPIPFNEPGIASPTHPIHCLASKTNAACQQYTYGYTIVDQNFNPIQLPNNAGSYLGTYEGGNVDLRVPYIGYSAESESYTAAGVSAYHALQTHIEKRMSHGLQVGFSYTYSHALDEQSALGLFYNGSNPQHLRDAYGSADFDRTHVINFSYVYELPKFFGESTLKGKLADGWSLQGVTVIQSGQPYSVIDFSGAVGSIYFGTSDGITNPIVPLVPGCNPVTGASGAFSTPALKADCFTLPILQPGALGGAIPSNDPYETNFTSGYRNIFRQAWQKRADVSIVKATQLTERVSMKYRFDVFNVTNTASFDVPLDDVTQNENFNDFPTQGSQLYNAPFGLGVTNKTIGSPRQVQMSLAFSF